MKQNILAAIGFLALLGVSLAAAEALASLIGRLTCAN